MKSLLKRLTGDQSPAEGDATGFPQAVANSVHSLLQRFTGPGMPTRDQVSCLTCLIHYTASGEGWREDTAKVFICNMGVAVSWVMRQARLASSACLCSLLWERY